jgi:hypothetical protein
VGLAGKLGNQIGNLQRAFSNRSLCQNVPDAVEIGRQASITSGQ